LVSRRLQRNGGFLFGLQAVWEWHDTFKDGHFQDDELPNELCTQADSNSRHCEVKNKTPSFPSMCDCSLIFRLFQVISAYFRLKQVPGYPDLVALRRLQPGGSGARLFAANLNLYHHS
jgi:hypothetical protein